MPADCVVHGVRGKVDVPRPRYKAIFDGELAERTAVPQRFKNAMKETGPQSDRAFQAVCKPDNELKISGDTSFNYVSV